MPTRTRPHPDTDHAGITAPPGTAARLAGAPRWLARIEHFVIDLDGTMMLGRSVYPWSPRFIEAVRRVGAGYTFLTNNDLLPDAELIGLLERQGVAVPTGGLYSAGRAVCDLLAERWPGARRVLCLGAAALREHLAGAGRVCVDPLAGADEPEVVVVGACPDATQRELARAAHWIARGLPWVATHPDVLIPSGDEPAVLGAGAVCAALRVATGRCPDEVAGKPNPAAFRRALARVEVDPSRVAVVGDSAEADLALACAVGARSVLLAEPGVPRRVDHFAGHPDLTVVDLGELARLISA